MIFESYRQYLKDIFNHYFSLFVIQGRILNSTKIKHDYSVWISFPPAYLKIRDFFRIMFDIFNTGYYFKLPNKCLHKNNLLFKYIIEDTNILFFHMKIPSKFWDSYYLLYSLYKVLLSYQSLFITIYITSGETTELCVEILLHGIRLNR